MSVKHASHTLATRLIDLVVRVFFSHAGFLDLGVWTRVMRVNNVGQWLDGVDMHAVGRKAWSGGYDNARMFVVGDKHPLQPYVTFLFCSTITVHG